MLSSNVFSGVASNTIQNRTRGIFLLGMHSYLGVVSLGHPVPRLKTVASRWIIVATNYLWIQSPGVKLAIAKAWDELISAIGRWDTCSV